MSKEEQRLTEIINHLRNERMKLQENDINGFININHNLTTARNKLKTVKEKESKKKRAKLRTA